MVKKILLAIDGSKHSIKAAEYAKELARQAKAEVTILNVGPIPLVYLLNYHPTMIEPDILPKEVEERIKEQGEAILKQALEIFKKSKVRVKIHFQYGHPAETICEFAENNKFDLIIVGSRGLGELKELFLGSISNKVAHICHCPVLIVK